MDCQKPGREKIILFGGGEIYLMGLDYCHQIDLTVIDISPDGGPNAALFPELMKLADQAFRGEIDPAGDLPGYRYECWYRATRRALFKAVLRGRG